MSLREAAAERGIPVKVRTGSPGQLQIFKDGIKIFDYKETGNLPPTAELLRRIST